MLTFREATINDKETLEYWDTLPHIIASDLDDVWDWEEELVYFPAWRKMYMVEFENQPIGFIQIIDPFEEETHYWGEVEPNQRAIDIWIGEPDFLYKGFGRKMMTKAIEICFAEKSVFNILIDPLVTNTKAHQFYRKMGFEFVERRQFEDSDCYVFQLTRQRWNSLT